MTRSLAFACVFLLIAGASAHAQPPLPSSFYGRVTLDGQNVSPGTVVSAWIDGVRFAEIAALTYEGQSVYALSVPGDDAESPATEGGVEGDTIMFRVAGYPSPDSAVWRCATNVEHDLSASSGKSEYLYLPLVLKP